MSEKFELNTYLFKVKLQDTQRSINTEKQNIISQRTLQLALKKKKNLLLENICFTILC